MKHNYKITMLALAALCGLSASAQDIKLKGVLQNNRYDDSDQMKSEYLGWDSNTSKAIFIVDNGIYAMTSNGSTLTTPTKDPAVNKQDIQGNAEKMVWATNFNLMYGNSGACYVDGQLVTVMSRDEQSTEDDVLFNVRKWDAATGDLHYNATHPKSSRLESAGMSYNPVDGKVYGLFYLTGNDLPEEITSDPEYFADQDDDMTDGDAGYAICTIDLTTMTVTPITPGLYYENFVTFAINSEGRAFALTSGGSSSTAYDSEGHQLDIDGNLTGAQLYEFNLSTGLKIQKAVEAFDEETGEAYTEYVPTVGATGFSSQYRRQSACFAKSNPNIMYWNGYYNSGKGINAYGSWGPLPDRDSATGQTWRDNHKYDTCIYAVDITTGKATRLATVPNRCIFSCIWVDGDDCSDGANMDILGIESITAKADNATSAVYNLAGQKVSSNQKGLQIVKQGNKVVKVMK